METKAWHPGLATTTELYSPMSGARAFGSALGSAIVKVYVVRHIAFKLEPKVAAFETRVRHKIRKLGTRP